MRADWLAVDVDVDAALAQEDRHAGDVGGADPHPGPLHRVGSEMQSGAPIREEQCGRFLLRAVRPEYRGCQYQVEIAEHRVAGTVGLVGERRGPPHRMMQSGGGFESHIFLGTKGEKPSQILRRREGVFRHSTRADFGKRAFRADGADQVHLLFELRAV